MKVFLKIIIENKILKGRIKNKEIMILTMINQCKINITKRIRRKTLKRRVINTLRNLMAMAIRKKNSFILRKSPSLNPRTRINKRNGNKRERVQLKKFMKVRILNRMKSLLRILKVFLGYDK